MAAISLNTAGRVEVVDPKDQITLTCGVAVTAAAPAYIDANGNWAFANSTDTAHSTGIYVLAKAGVKGDNVTGFRAAIMDGFNLTAQAYGAPIYLADAGGFADAAGTVSVLVARVVPATANSFASGAPRDKVLRIAAPL